MKISTCLIGEDSLLIQCGEILLNRGHDLTLIVSPVKKIQNWAKKNNIPLLKNINDISKPNSNYSIKFDFIFSIVNSHILPSSVLQLAKYAAINYHDSPLPKYAGLNATSWAILKGEKKHGITWHLMANKIDQGDIVAQQTFPIYDNDTALSLNLRCYEFAIDSFEKLIEAIENKKLNPRQQSLLERSYYASDAKLPNFGFIDWQHFSAEQIDKICKALTFGPSPNTLGSLKLYCSSSYLLITKLEIAKLDWADKMEPGVVLLVETDAIYVATNTKPIKITGLTLANGHHLTIAQFVNIFSIQVGYKFESLNSSGLTLLQESYSSSVKHEKFWLANLTELTEHTIFSPKGMGTTQAMNAENKEINLKNLFPNKKIPSINTILVTAILIYLIRSNNHEDVSVFFIKANFAKYYNTCANFFSYLLPCNFKLATNFSLSQTLNFVEENILTVSNKGCYLTDITARYPEFSEKLVEPTIIIGFNDDKFTPSLLPSQSMLYFQVDAKMGAINVYHRFELSSQIMLKQIFANLSQHITNILINLINNPHLSMAHFSFLTEHERYQLLRNLGPGEKRFLPTTLSIAAIFEKQVLAKPKNIAITTRQRSISYRELWDASEKIADFIKANGLAEQSMIGIYLDRSIEMMAVILGILRANAIYVPLDPKYPMPRIQYIFNEAKIDLLFTQDKFRAKLNGYFSDHSQTHIFSIENILDSNGVQSEPKHPIKNDNNEKLAYVMFTSGTTGTPKGVMVTHGNVINYCYWFLESTRFSDASIIDFSSSIAFDLSIPCTIAPLLAGGCIAICEETEKTNPRQYLIHLKKHRITHIEITPGYLHLLLNYPEEIRQLHELKWILLGADAIAKTDVLKWLALCPQHQMVNEYGPTETTVAVTSYFIDTVKLPVDSAVPIGRPAYNTQCYLLDKYKNLCPIGMPGELYIGGAQISKGYLNKANLTQDKFIVCNLNKANEALYKTGDFAYWLADGNLQFLGRNDHQVKIQGYRVEIAEIESALKQIPAINQAIVVAQEGKFKNQYLRAYLVCDKLINCDAEIKKNLATYLPNYMIPKEFCLVEFIPLKENEKIDYEALKKQSYQLLTASPNKSSASNTNFHNITLQIWQQIFNNESITIHDSFFDIGGDSIIALLIIDEMQKHYSIDIPVSYLFEYPTVALLTHKICELYRLEQKPESSPAIISTNNTIIQLSQGNYPTPIFLIHPIGGTIFWYTQLASLLQGKYTIYGIQDPNIDGKNVFFESLEDMAAYYLAEIKKIYAGENYCLGGASFGSTVAFAMAHQLISAGKKISFLGLLDGWAHYPEDIQHDNYAKLLRNGDIYEQKLTKSKRDTLVNLESYRQTLLKKYRLPFLNLNVALFKASELWPLFQNIEDFNNGWRAYIGGQIRTYKVPGNHESMFFPPHVQTLAEIVHKHIQHLIKHKLNTAEMV